MAHVHRTLLGHMKCLCCGQAIPVKEAENGTLNAACSWCDFPAWAKKGTLAARIIRSRIIAPPADQAPAPAVPPAPTKPPAAPAAAAAPASVFHL